MTQEEKQLLLIDLSARLPYGVKVTAATPKGEKTGTIVTITAKFIHSHQDSKIFGEFYADDNDECFWLDFGLFKSYLRPMSSMTPEEKEEYHKHVDIDIEKTAKRLEEQFENGTFDKESQFTAQYCHTDWLNANHFDYRGLIEKGLALEAPEGMYKTE